MAPHVNMTKAAKWYGLGDTSDGLGTWKVAGKYSKMTGDTVERSVAMCCPQKGILLPHSCESMVVDKLKQGLRRLIHWGMRSSDLKKIPKCSFTAHSGTFEYGTTVVW
jgi:hypothetical protein